MLLGLAVALLWPATIVSSVLFVMLTDTPADPHGYVPIFSILGSIFLGAVLFAVGLPIAVFSVLSAAESNAHELASRPDRP
jgi:hypothetical protein